MACRFPAGVWQTSGIPVPGNALRQCCCSASPPCPAPTPGAHNPRRIPHDGHSPQGPFGNGWETPGKPPKGWKGNKPHLTGAINQGEVKGFRLEAVVLYIRGPSDPHQSGVRAAGSRSNTPGF
ncbi:hypothetical protein EYF80_000357 [Liparis tanakae]|uniref:Uncharacterized protein n=1 Tax=Liparis tanakae TaxID=230148 RepID=A0A4Z2JFN7_9TELE|nr:hypothetical protein EYF80_000357 [Liparis tanakae]